jgi:hypothetical protein
VFSAPDTINTKCTLANIYIDLDSLYDEIVHTALKTSSDPPLDLGPQNILICIWMDKKTVDDKGVV